MAKVGICLGNNSGCPPCMSQCAQCAAEYGEAKEEVSEDVSSLVKEVTSLVSELRSGSSQEVDSWDMRLDHEGSLPQEWTFDITNARACELLSKALIKRDKRIRELESVLHEVLSDLEGCAAPASPDPIYHAEVKQLGERIGFGALMKTASAGWRETLERNYPSGGGGEFAVGPCVGTLQYLVKNNKAGS